MMIRTSTLQKQVKTMPRTVLTLISAARKRRMKMKTMNKASQARGKRPAKLAMKRMRTRLLNYRKGKRPPRRRSNFTKA